MKMAAIQMVSTPDVERNLQAMARLVAQAAAQGARLVALPEYFCLMGRRDTDKVAVAEGDGEGPIQHALAQAAKRHRLWLVGGTLPIRVDGRDDRVRNASLVFGPEGQRVARYDKIHLFGFTKGAEHYDEASFIEPGRQIVTVDTPFARIGLSICYDLRFPELYRGMGELALIVVPAAFTATTGAAHWHLLLRARAVENQCYVLAAAQGGLHPNGRRTFGHSLLVDPWGEIAAEWPEGAGVASGNIDGRRLAEVRTQLPALKHRVL